MRNQLLKITLLLVSSYTFCQTVDLRSPFDRVSYQQSSKPVVGGNKSVAVTVVLVAAPATATPSDTCPIGSLKMDPLNVSERQPDTGIPVNPALLVPQNSGLQYTFNIPIGSAGVLSEDWQSFSFRVSFNCSGVSAETKSSPVIQVQRLLDDPNARSLTFSSQPIWYKSGTREHIDFAVQANEEIRISSVCLIRDPQGSKENVGCALGDDTTATSHYYTIVPTPGHSITAGVYGYMVKATQFGQEWVANTGLPPSHFINSIGDYTVLNIDESKLVLTNLNQSTLPLDVTTSDQGILSIRFDTTLPDTIVTQDISETTTAPTQTHRINIPVKDIGAGNWQFHFQGSRASDSQALAGIRPYHLKITSTTSLVGDLSMKLDGNAATLSYKLTRDVPHKIEISSPDFANQALNAFLSVNPLPDTCSPCSFENKQVDLSPLLNSADLQKSLSNNTPVRIKIAINDESPDANGQEITGVVLLFSKPTAQVDVQKIAQAQNVLQQNKNNTQQATTLVKQALAPSGTTATDQNSNDALVNDIVSFLKNNRDSSKSNWLVQVLKVGGSIAAAYFGIPLPAKVTSTSSAKPTTTGSSGNAFVSTSANASDH